MYLPNEKDPLECTPQKRPRLHEDDTLDMSVSPEASALVREESDLGVEQLPSPPSPRQAATTSSDFVAKTCHCSGEKVDQVDQSVGPDTKFSYNVATQTPPSRLSPYSITDFQCKPEELRDLTGIESYDKFLLIFNSLGPNIVSELKYRKFNVKNLSLEDQFFLTLWKLRKATSDTELGMHFGIHHTTASNIFISWVTFMANQWGKLDLWPSRDLIDYYMPEGFKRTYPSTRVIVDATEIPIEKPTNPTAQQATFSTYKNGNTLKVLVGASPSGLISFASEAYGGSTSDRQIVERSVLPELCSRGDSVMADRGINVQDIFAPKGVAVNIPAFLRGKDHLTGAVIMNDRKLASKRVHIERLIGLIKIYHILKTKLNHHYVSHGSNIFFVCFMLSNFRENIVSQKA
ncbi:hypothetical protein FOCC_FOCC002699 [Frankliniella occidentalis]|uniref:Uncharacterized protein LOC127748845 n=1 Tax=Frankliniella occidentalis TaxID=133901 RepID=A0A9C6TP13_FRAOC|nr:uncharacterized protein LOC127748845 [Frankliniella occidentalis]KAE8750722.1 hypothetical protein FOCC_FOCC002699 [Frankliniella occidentalis]